MQHANTKFKMSLTAGVTYEIPRDCSLPQCRITAYCTKEDLPGLQDTLI